MEDQETNAFTILLVEDQRIDAKLIKFCIMQLPLSLSINHVSTSDEALQYIDKCCSENQQPLPDLVLLDLNLTGHGGLTILKEIRSRLQLKFIPVVIFSTSSYDKDVLACYEAGANSYIIKPSHFGVFRITLERAVTYWLEINNSAFYIRELHDNRKRDTPKFGVPL